MSSRASAIGSQDQSAGRGPLRFAFALLFVALLAGQRFGLNLGSYSISAGMQLMYACLLLAAVGRVLDVNLERLLLYLSCLAIASVSWLVNAWFSSGRQTSMPSLVLLAMMYLPFVFSIKPGTFGPDGAAWTARVFLNVALFCALAGIWQFYAQFVISSRWLFDFTPDLPTIIQGPGGNNTVIPVGSLYKSNGFFFREPSGFSFAMALALLVECFSLKRLRYVACFALALLLSYSGTGILALVIGMLFPLGGKTILRFALLGASAALVIYALGDALNLSFTLSRIEEFESQGSSAYIRYLAPMRLVLETLTAQEWSFWVGYGPGAISREVRSYEFHDPTWAKLLFEYGVLGLAGFVGLFLSILRKPGVPIQVRAALFFSWLIMGGHLLSAESNYLTLALVGLLPPVLGQFSANRAAPVLPEPPAERAFERGFT